MRYFITGFIASWSYTLLFDVRDLKTLATTALGGGISWLLYRQLLLAGLSSVTSMFFASILMSLYAELMARLMKKPVTIYLITGMLPLVPGQGIFETMQFFVRKQPDAGVRSLTETLAVSGAIAVGSLLAATMARFFIARWHHSNNWSK